MRIALKQNNLHLGHDHLMDVSDPTSETYGQHWSAERLAEYFAPSQESVDAVKGWLVSSGIADGRISRSFSQGWIELDASILEIESLLQAAMYMYRHESGHIHVACKEYSVPEGLQEHIDFITPTVHFDVKPSKRREKRESSSTVAANGVSETSKFIPHSFALLDPNSHHNSPAQNFTPHGIERCDQNITIDCLRALYDIPAGHTANPDNSFGISEFSNFYLPSDLDMFFKIFAPQMEGDRPILNSIDGGEDSINLTSFALNGESDLDLEYAMSLVYPQKVQLYQVGDLVENASFNTFLDASYCTFDGGDDPTQDPIYPDPSNQTGAFHGPKACGTYKPTWVISTSYGSDEVGATPAYEER
jgi:tripeptidyl-peptidase-1